MVDAPKTHSLSNAPPQSVYIFHYLTLILRPMQVYKGNNVFDCPCFSDPKKWTVEDVIDWLKFKGFDKDTCEKFSSACRQLILLYADYMRLCRERN
jgi:hypothetical protein